MKLKMFFFLRESKARIDSLEKEKEKQQGNEIKAKDSVPTPESTPKPNLQPNRLDFSTPRSGARKTCSKIGTPLTPSTPSTPDTSRISDIECLDASLEAGSSVSSMTPDLVRLNLGRGQGRLRKEMTKPTMEDFPLDGSEEEQKKYIARK